MAIFTSLFDTPTAPVAARGFTPALDIVESDDAFVVTADVPGLAADDVTIDVTDNVLTLSGERATESHTQHAGYARVERRSGRFSRSLRLPRGVDADAIAASLKDGVLELRVPKPEAIKPKRVEISVGDAPAIEA